MPTLAELYPELYGQPAETLAQNKPGFVTSLKRSGGQMAAGLGVVQQDAGFGDSLLRYGEDVINRNPSGINSFEDIAEHPWLAVQEGAASGIGFLGPQWALGLAGKGLAALGAGTRFAGEAGLVGRAAANPWIGGTGVAALPSVYGIDQTQRQTGEVDLLAKYGGAALSGAIEQFGGPQRFIRPEVGRAAQTLIGGVTRGELAQMAPTALRTLGRGVVRVAGEEAGEEALQNPIEQYAGGQDPLANEQLYQTAFGATMGAIGGGVFGLASGGRRAMQQRGLQPQARSVLDSQMAPFADQAGAAEVLAHFQGGDPQVQIAQLLRQRIAEGMTMGTPVDLMGDFAALEQLGVDNGQLFNDVINPYDVGGQVSAFNQGQETGLDEQQLGLFGGGGAQPFTPPLSEQEGYAPLPAGEPMQAFPHQGQVMPMGVPVEEQVSRAASIMAGVVRGANVLLTDQQWADQVLKTNLTPSHYNAFMAQLQEGGRQIQQQKGQAKAPTQAQPKTQVPAVAPTTNEFVGAYKKAGGPYSPVMKQLEGVKDKEQALQVIRDTLEHKTPAQKVVRALEELHKHLSGQTMTEYMRGREAQEKADPKAPGPVTITKGDANVPMQEVRQKAQAGQVPDAQKVGAPDVDRQVVLQGTAGTKEGAQPGTQVQAEARTKDQGARGEADAKQSQAVRFKEPFEAQQFILQKVAEKDPRKAKVLALHLGWGGEQSLPGPEIGERLGISRQRVNQLLKDLMKDGGIVESTMTEHGIELQDLREKDPYEETHQPGDAPASPKSSLEDKRADTSAAGIVDERGEEGDTNRNTGFSTGPISKLNSSNITGEVGTKTNSETGEVTEHTGVFTPDQEGQANERLESFEKAKAEDDVEGQAQLVWDAAVSHYNAQGEKLKTWSEIGKTEQGQKTQQDFIERFKKSVDSAKRDVLQMAAFRKLVKGVYYSRGRSFEEKDMRHDGVQRALRELQANGLTKLLDWGTVNISDEMGTADGRAMLSPDGTFDIFLAHHMFEGVKSDKHISHVLRHELSHAVDQLGGFSLKGSFDAVVAETKRLYDMGDHLSVWRAYMSYPFDYFKKFDGITYQYLDGEEVEALKSEVFAQVHAMWMVPNGRTIIQDDAPQTAAFLRKAQDEIREALETNPGPLAAQRGGAQSDAGAQPGAGHAGPRVFDHPAFHGSPHDFENFTTQKIGTGEAIRYLDGGSRTHGQGSHNYVIFDDKLVTITARESRGRSFEELPDRELFKPQLHEGFAKQIDEVAAAVKRGEPYRRAAAANLVLVGRTPVVLRAIQTITGEKPFRKSDGIVGTGATVYLKAVDDHQASSHGFKVPVETLKQLPQLLADPVAVFRSGQNSDAPDSYKVLLDAEVDGKPVIVGLRPNQPQRELQGEEHHFTATIFPLANGWYQVRTWMREGLLRYYDDKRAPAVQPGTNPQGLTGARGQRPDFSVAKSPVKVVTKSELENTPKERWSMGQSFEETYPEELKPSASMLRSALADTATNWAKKGLQAVVFAHDLVDIAVKEGLTTAKGFFDLLNAKSAKRIRMEAEIDRIMTKAADIPDRIAVNKFLQTSTRDQRWGYKPAWKSDVETDPGMEAAYGRLSDAGKEVVDEVFRMGDENYAEIQRLVNKEINDEYDARLLKAASQDSRDQVEAERKKALRSMGRTLPKLQGPYAPLKRFGDYVSVAKSAAYVDAEQHADAKELTELQEDERHYVVEFHDTFAAAKARARQLAPYFAKTDGFEKQKIYRDVQELPWSSIAKVKGAINDMPDGTAHKAALGRLVTDLYLTMLSENSARKVELKRRGIHGEERDMLRSFASQGRASAHFIAALEKNGEIQAQISRMQTEATEGEGRDNKNRVFNEILARYAQGLDYRPSPLVEKAMTFTSLWMLVTSPAYYLQNSTQPFMLTLPVLAGRYGNGAGWAALTKAYKDVGRFVKQMGHTLDVDKLPLADEERAMLKHLRDTGRIDITIAQDLGRWVGGEQFYHRGVFGKVMREVWAMPQRVEMLNRVVSAIAAYRLSHGNTEYAGQILDQTHGNYASSNAPRLMNANPAMRLITQFRKFQLIQISLLGRLAHDAFKNSSPQERAVARAALGWVLTHHLVAAGALGLPAANIVGYVLAAAFGDDDKPKDFETMVREAIGDKAVADLLLRGAPTLAGVDVSSRIGMGQAFSVLPFTDIKLTDRDSLAKTIMSAGGPLLGGVAPKLADGMGYIHNGDYLKGFASILPRGLADAIKAYGLATQGLTQKNNDTVMKPSELSMFDVMSQAVGLPSMALSDRGRRVGQVIDTEEYYKDRTGVLKHKYAAAYRENDVDEMREMREEWQEVARVMREQGLKPQPLSNLLKAPQEQHKRERQVIEGVAVKRGNREFVRRQAEL